MRHSPCQFLLPWLMAAALSLSAASSPPAHVVVTSPVVAAGGTMPVGQAMRGMGVPAAGGIPVQSAAANPRPSPQFARVIVKLRTTAVTGAAMAAAPGGPSPAPVAATPEARLQALATQHGARAAAPLSPGHARARQQAALTKGKTQAAAPQRFPARAARAPANAVKPDLSTTYVLDLGPRAAGDVAAALSALRADPNVLYAEEDKVMQAQYVPSDPDYPGLYAMPKISAAQAWDVTKGQGVVVAVVDTGIDYNHPDISANVWSNPAEVPDNGIDDDNNGFIDDARGWDFVGRNSASPADDKDPFDVHSHGTHVAGTIAATGDNSLGVVGVAWQAKIMALKGLDDAGFGPTSSVARAIIYAADNGADVINASLAGEGSSPTVTAAVDYAHALGVVFVAAAGNNSADAKDFYPANVSNAIAVSALTAGDDLASFSNRGGKVEIAAPGVNIRSLEAGTSGYSVKDGTSMAAPHVSGVAALVIAAHPTWSGEQVRQALRVSATDLGSAGRDNSFGYGRVNAAQAVLVSEVLEAQIASPAAGTAISAVTALTGTASGAGFDHYVVDYGVGVAPATWTTIRNSAAPVTNGNIGSFDPTTITDGTYTLRLRVYTAGGAVFSDHLQLQVRYLEITSPAPPDVPLLTPELKPGVAYQITGSARGPSFQNYLLEWAPGAAATSGWSNTGFVLVAGGLAPITNGSLGTWTPPGTLTGFHTIRLTVANTGFSSTTTTTIYAEPALISSAWPRFIGPALSYQSVQPVRQPDGSFRFVLAGNASISGSIGYSLNMAGSVTTTPLDFGGQKQPAVGELDGQPGEEVVMADGLALKIFSSTLGLVRTIVPSVPRVFWPDQTTLADLDGDGSLEIIAPARDTQSAAGANFRSSGALYVYRADGTLFSGNYPVTITSPLTADGSYDGGEGVFVAVADLDGDGDKEIVMAIEAGDYSGYTLKALNADGTPFAGWPAPSFSGQVLSLAAADLDRDGTVELVLAEYVSNPPNPELYQIRVVNSTGVVRPGWPAAQASFTIHASIGDLDRDGRNEIVTSSNRTLSIWDHQGMTWGPSWSSGDQMGGMSPLLADIDGDGLPEITVSTHGQREIRSYGLSGEVKRSWRMFGLAGQQITAVTPAVGDFNQDGLTDLVINLPLIDGGTDTGFLNNIGVTCLTTGTAFNAALSDWPGRFRDPQNSNAVPASQVPVITGQPSSQAVTSGQTATLAVGASGSALNYQWRKGAVNLAGTGRVSGTAGPTLTIANAQPGDAGSYVVVVSNAAGTVFSSPAIVTINTDFNVWAQDKFTAGELSAAAISGPNADPDRDGWVNLVEYALGLEPKTADVAVLPATGVLGSDWTYTYTRPADRTDITYAVEVSTDLSVWSTAGVTHGLVAASGGTETWQAKYPVAAADNVFFRLKVMRP